ncbi:ACT domain-containing protein ACR1-like [Vicia villosa]|uniref:ACT domain-containing protein ACR1-like n=1 Tax=Vicia villosa TaxID=3911 RepID=UPI00273CD964|nr:ACT domain-containing protein ACR1-like [Vicia villosa]
METVFHSRLNREIETLTERLHPPRVCIDNNSCKDCTVLKVDSANKYGILLEMVQVLTDLDLIISKSYISSDGGWFMDVFHVTDQAGNKVTDNNLMQKIEKELCATRAKEDIDDESELESCGELESYYTKLNVSTENTALEMSGMDRPGLLSEISAVLVEMGCNVTSATAWTHNRRAACIIYVEEKSKPGPIKDPKRLAHVKEELETVVQARGVNGDRNNVRLRNFATGCTHTERRLHQLMYADKDYEGCRPCHGYSSGEHKRGCDGTHVSISRCKDRGYWVVNVICKDRPKLLFDTVCVLRDMHYVVFHAAISSKKSIANQEYFIRHKMNNLALQTEIEREKLVLCIIAAIERRVCHGLRVDICTPNRVGLLSKVTRVIQENGLSIPRVEIGTRGENVVGTFYVTNPLKQEVNPKIVELLRQECGGSVEIVTDHKCPCGLSRSSSSSSVTSESNGSVEDKRKISIGSMLWSHIGKFSSNFGPIKY